MLVRPSACSWMVSRTSWPSVPEELRCDPQRRAEAGTGLECDNEQIDQLGDRLLDMPQPRLRATLDDHHRALPADDHPKQDTGEQYRWRRAGGAHQPHDRDRERRGDHQPVAEELADAEVEEAGRDELLLDLALLEAGHPPRRSVAQPRRVAVDDLARGAAAYIGLDMGGRVARRPRCGRAARAARRLARRARPRRRRPQRRRAARP